MPSSAPEPHPNARLLKATTAITAPELVKVRIDNASLASQAVGPPTSDLEMGFLNRPQRDVGRRLLTARPLAKQLVAKDDSVLAPMAMSNLQQNGRGLIGSYMDLIRQAFKREWWDSLYIVATGPGDQVTFKIGLLNGQLAANEYTFAEYNFSLFFGLAIQLYEMTLISDNAPIDRFFEGDTNAISDQAKRGMAVFQANGCAGCHSGGEFTNASTRILLGAQGEPAEIVERMPTGNCQIGLYDQSFYNIGVRPWFEDLGIGAMDPFGNPLAIAKVLTTPPSQIPSQELLSIPYPNIVPGGPAIGERTISEGAFKVPSLRNISATAPYFHNGGQATLRQVVEFYNRGGDFRETNEHLVDLEIGKLNLTNQELDDMVAFLETLTDDRVLKASAPFDHPQLFVPDGAQGNNVSVTVGPDGSAADALVEVPAVGRNGGAELPPFLGPTSKFTVSSVFDNKNGKVYPGSDGADPYNDLNSTTEAYKVEVESGSTFWWEAQFTDPPTGAGNPVGTVLTLQYRPEESWTGTFTAQVFNGTTLLTSLALPVDSSKDPVSGKGRLSTYQWDISSAITSRAVLAGSKVRLVNTGGNGKKVWVSYMILNSTLAP